MKASWLLLAKINLLFLIVVTGYFLNREYPIAEFSEVTLPLTENSYTILKQPFFYLGEGEQSIAFIGKDGKTVLKFFRDKHCQKTLFKSTELAYTQLKNETGIISVHLAPTTTPLSVELFDLSGKAQRINLKQIPFIVQKKAIPFFSVLENEITKNNRQKVESMIDALISTYRTLYDRGIWETDNSLRRNVGYSENSICLFDIGSFIPTPNMSNGNEEKEIVIRNKTIRLERWLKKHGPDYLPFYQKKLSEVSNP